MARNPLTQSTSGGDDQIWLEDLWDEPEPKAAHSTRFGLEALRGSWVSVSGRRQAKFLFSGSRFAVHFADGDIYMGSIVLNPDGRLGTMDILIEEGPRHKGLTALCLYEMDGGDTLRWVTAPPGLAERPASFEEPDQLHLCLVLRREHPNNGNK